MKAVLCPVCNGRGKVPPEGHYTGTTDVWPTCHGCGGRGWVTVPEYAFLPINPESPEKYNYTISDSAKIYYRWDEDKRAWVSMVGNWWFEPGLRTISGG